MLFFYFHKQKNLKKDKTQQAIYDISFFNEIIII